ncbi:MAG: cytochrome P460 family protein [Pirellulales bacterium]
MSRLIVCVALFAFTVALSAQTPGEREPDSKAQVSSNRLLEMTADRAKALIRVTDKPHDADLLTMLGCRAPLPRETPALNPHLDHVVHVYVTSAGERTLRDGHGEYPVGTVILKEKLPGAHRDDVKRKAAAKSAPELFTGMLKREKGYHPECGDWEFFVVDGAAKQMQARGRIDSCVECHKDYKDTDFVTRTYLRQNKTKASK